MLTLGCLLRWLQNATSQAVGAHDSAKPEVEYALAVCSCFTALQPKALHEDMLGKHVFEKKLLSATPTSISCPS